MAKVELTDFEHFELVEYFDYLDDLRESGRTNMWGAGAYLRAEQGLDRHEAEAVLSAWMDTFSDDASDERVDAALEKEAAS